MVLLMSYLYQVFSVTVSYIVIMVRFGISATAAEDGCEILGAAANSTMAPWRWHLYPIMAQTDVDNTNMSFSLERNVTGYHCVYFKRHQWMIIQWHIVESWGTTAEGSVGQNKCIRAFYFPSHQMILPGGCDIILFYHCPMNTCKSSSRAEYFPCSIHINSHHTIP